jgi:hypothetical protein
MARSSSAFRRRRILLFATMALLAGCDSRPKHNSAENEFNAWANDVERGSANGQAPGDFEEPTNVMARTAPANGQ